MLLERCNKDNVIDTKGAKRKYRASLNTQKDMITIINTSRGERKGVWIIFFYKVRKLIIKS